LIDLDMMRLPAVWTNNMVALLIGIGMYAVFGFLPEFVQTPTSTGYGFGLSITQSGLVLLPSTITMFITGSYVGRFAKVVGNKALVVVGCLLGMVSMMMLAVAHHDRWELYIATGIMGIAFGLAFSAMSSLIVSSVPVAQTGVASGMNANIRTIGGSIGSAMMASIVTSSLARDGLPKEAGYTIGFALLGVALIVAAVAAVLIPTSSRAGSANPDDEPAHAELAMIAGGTIVGDKPE
jgi:MFS family permease